MKYREKIFPLMIFLPTNRKLKYDKAEEFLKKAVDLDPSYWTAWNNLGWVYQEQGHYDLMRDAFTASITHNNNSTWNYIGLGVANILLGNYDNAILQLTKADNKTDPSQYSTRAKIYIYLGIATFKNNKEHAADSYFEKALRLHPDDTESGYKEIGYMLYKYKEYYISEKYLKKALEIDPKYASVWNNLGWTYGKQERFQLMRDAFEKAIRFRDKEEAGDSLGLGTALYALGSFQSAIDTVVNLETDSFTKKYVLALSYLALGDEKKARDILDKESILGVSYINDRNQRLKIGTLYPNSPADKAGLKTGDQIVSVNGEDVSHLSSIEFGRKVRDIPFGTDILFVVQRNGSSHAKTVNTLSRSIAGSHDTPAAIQSSPLAKTQTETEPVPVARPTRPIQQEQIQPIHKPFITTGSYHALVIGNNSYQYLPNLQTAVQDARDVAKLLENQYGFTVQLMLDVTRDQIVDAINRQRNRLGSDDNFLLYFAGHGQFDTSATKAYWLPIDAREDVDTNWIIVDTVTSNLKRMAARHVLVVSDSCYSGTMTRRVSPTLKTGVQRHRYLKQLEKKRCRILLASGGNEPVADSGYGKNSVFAQAFLEGLNRMEERVFTSSELFHSQIREQVAGNADQVPEYNIIRNSGHNGGDFVFVRNGQ